MNLHNSNAVELPVNERKISMINYAHRRNMLKQKLYGLAITAVCSITALAVAETILILFIPFGIFLMLTKMSIMIFEYE